MDVAATVAEHEGLVPLGREGPQQHGFVVDVADDQ